MFLDFLVLRLWLRHDNVCAAPLLPISFGQGQSKDAATSTLAVERRKAAIGWHLKAFLGGPPHLWVIHKNFVEQVQCIFRREMATSLLNHFIQAATILGQVSYQQTSELILLRWLSTWRTFLF